MVVLDVRPKPMKKPNPKMVVQAATIITLTHKDKTSRKILASSISASGFVYIQAFPHPNCLPYIVGLNYADGVSSLLFTPF